MHGLVIELKDVSRTYGEGETLVRALDGVSLEIRRGEFVAIMGASGCGKSTLLHVLGCLDRPTSGVYRLEGHDVSSASEPELAALRGGTLGFVFQSFNLLARTSAVDNVSLPLTYATSRAEAAMRARSALAEVGLAARAENRPNQLSGGQQQRVAIARALINGPRVLLADEPTGNLDSANAREISAMLARLNRERGLTIVLVTHDAEVAEYARRKIVMRDGRVLSDTVREPPATVASEERAAWSGDSVAPARVASFLPAALRSSFDAIRRNPLRSALTLTGIMIGVASLVAMVSIGMGVHAAVAEQIDRLGANLIVVQPGASVAGGARGAAGSSSTLFESDAEALREAPSVRDVGYANKTQGQAAYLDRNWSTTIQGVSSGLLRIQDWTLDQGRSFEESEYANAARVCLLGQTVYHNLFAPGESPIGASVIVRGVPLEVVGLLSELGQTGGGRDQDDLVLIPFSTARSKVIGDPSSGAPPARPNWIYPSQRNPFGIAPRLGGRVQSIFVQAARAKRVDAAIAETTAILRARHHVPSGETSDFDVKNLSQAAQAKERTSVLLGRLLAAIAAITLLVGGIGIMNIMLVSVTERTREIGIRLAVGARRVHILLQFLLESVSLSVIGGAAGAVIGILFSWSAARLAGWPVLLSVQALAGGIAFSAAVGSAFGWYPARRASLLRPIDALRYE